MSFESPVPIYRISRDGLVVSRRYFMEFDGGPKIASSSKVAADFVRKFLKDASYRLDCPPVPGTNKWSDRLLLHASARAKTGVPKTDESYWIWKMTSPNASLNVDMKGTLGWCVTQFGIEIKHASGVETIYQTLKDSAYPVFLRSLRTIEKLKDSKDKDNFCKSTELQETYCHLARLLADETRESTPGPKPKKGKAHAQVSLEGSTLVVRFSTVHTHAKITLDDKTGGCVDMDAIMNFFNNNFELRSATLNQAVPSILYVNGQKKHYEFLELLKEKEIIYTGMELPE